MKILIDQAAAAATSFPIELFPVLAHTCVISAEATGATPAATTSIEGNPDGEIHEFPEAADGSRTTFTARAVGRTSNREVVAVEKDGVSLTSGWSVSGPTVTFTTAPAAGSVLRYCASRKGAWTEISAQTFSAADSAAVSFSDVFRLFRAKLNTVTNMKVTVSIESRN